MGHERGIPSNSDPQRRARSTKPERRRTKRVGPSDTRRSRPPEARKLPTMAVAVGLVVAAGIAAVALATISTERETGATSEVGRVEVEGQLLPKPPLREGEPDPAIGMTAPIVRGESFDGNPISIGSDQRPTLVIVMAHWCPHCQAEVPRIVEWTRERSVPEGVSVVAVSTAVREGAPNYPPSSWLRRERWPFPVLADDENQSAQEAYGVTSYPSFVLLGKDRRVLYRGSGELAMPQWESLIELAVASSRLDTRPIG